MLVDVFYTVNNENKELLDTFNFTAKGRDDIKYLSVYIYLYIYIFFASFERFISTFDILSSAIFIYFLLLLHPTECRYHLFRKFITSSDEMLQFVRFHPYY